MKYFIATVLTKGKKKEIGFYAENRKEANQYAKLKFTGIIIKVVEATEPLEAQLKRFNNRVYATLFKSPVNDPWYGLAPTGVYTALEKN